MYSSVGRTYNADVRQIKRLLNIIAAVLLSMTLLYGFAPVSAAALPCTTPTSVTAGNLCIVELQTRGADGNEDEDYVIIANPTSFAITLSSVQLQYINSNGVLDASISAGSGSILPGQLKMYVSDSLATLNGSAAKLTGSTAKISLASAGGTLQIAKVLTSGTTIYDKVGWGSASADEKLPVPLQPDKTTLIRRQVAGVFQDTDDNSTDIISQPLSCRGPDINEIQPFVTDELGDSVDAWIELAGNGNAPGDCVLLTGAGDSYIIPAADQPLVAGSLAAINRGLDSTNQPVPLHIGDATGQIWLASTSYFGGAAAVKIPFSTQKYSSMVKGQSWALVDGIWRRTYSPTPSTANIYTADAPVISPDTSVCEAIRISEVFPNPVGNESGNEWVEIHNESGSPTPVGGCVIDIAGTTYSFLPDDVLGADEWRSFTALYTTDGDTKVITLRNSDNTQIVLRRLSDNATIQSFIYSNAPEGESYARFDDGWAWTYQPTPGSENILESSLPVPFLTEYPIATGAGGSGGVTADTTNSGLDTTPPQLMITEILPNPALPATDENDEFVELYNAGSEPVSLKGYKIQTGLDYSHSVTLSDQTIVPGGFYVLTSGASSLSLTNSGGRVRLLDPSGNVVSETDAYGEAVEGESWAYIDGVWQWTSKPTPSETNVYAAPIIIPGKTSTTTKKVSTKVAAAPKVKAATTAKTTTAKKTAAAKTAKQTDSASNSPEAGKTVVHAAVIAGIGGLAVLYGAYEYRGDISNTIYKLKRNRANRRENRS